MKKTIATLMLGILPSGVLASGDHASGHDMKRMEHGSHAMPGMARAAHEVAAGRPGNPDKISRTVEVTMDDTMRFVPDEMVFRAGETVRFVVRNAGRIRHEMVIGTVTELKEHAEMMRKMSGMHHAEPNTISLAPGEVGDLIWQFDNAGSFNFACLVPGHLEAGMTGKIAVERKR